MSQHTVRYFIYDEELDQNEDPDPIVECSEDTFLSYDGNITYERHTVHQNGCAQICLTKYPKWME